MGLVSIQGLAEIYQKQADGEYQIKIKRIADALGKSKTPYDMAERKGRELLAKAEYLARTQWNDDLAAGREHSPELLAWQKRSYAKREYSHKAWRALHPRIMKLISEERQPVSVTSAVKTKSVSAPELSQEIIPAAYKNTVFLAMQFDETQLKFLKGTLGQCFINYGLEFSTLPDFFTRENILDLKLRDAIRGCRMLVCDLTHRNDGAYFEAGFAEGVGKPVIYICEETTWQEHEANKHKNGDRLKRLHFDFDHLENYRWKNGDEKSIVKFKEAIMEKIKTVLE